ncbi:MAG: DUF2341 domain-containing protein, partial [Candidatus Diapherotrites archaeon]|nr:DUF2341 domain-containing protein [Candidatus Diapherotrites archaeon]
MNVNKVQLGFFKKTVFVFVFVLMFFSFSLAAGTWWDSNWDYRNPITITETSGSELIDFQVPIDLADAIYDNSGLVGSWHFSEGSGQSAADMSGNSNNGQLGSASTPDVSDPTWTTGKFGNGLQFDGVDDYVSVSDDASLDIVGDVSIMAWVNADSVPATYKFIAGKGPGGDENYDLRVMEGVGTFVFLVRDSAGYYYANTGISSTGTWIHLVGVFDSSSKEAKVYANGELKDTVSTTYSVLNTNNEPFSVGARYYGGLWRDFLDGAIDEVRVYDRALSETEIQEYFSAGKARLDYSDLRFTDDSDTQELSYWLENDNKAWVKVPSIPANSSTDIHMYYGNPTAESVSSGSGTFEFFDDFEGTVLDEVKWDILSGAPNVSGGVCTVESDKIRSDNSFSAPVVVEWRVNQEDGNDADTGLANDGRTDRLWFTRGTSCPNHVEWMDSGSSGVQPIADWFGDYKTLKVEWADDDNAKWYVDNNLRHSQTGDIPDAGIKMQFISSGDNPAIKVDWTFARKYASSEPVLSAGGEEQIKWLDEWHDYNGNEFPYRKPITLSNAGSILSDYQVQVDSDTSSLISSNKMQADCDDLRFVYRDGSDYFQLPHWVESGCNTSGTKVWVKVPSVPNGDS